MNCIQCDLIYYNIRIQECIKKMQIFFDYDPQGLNDSIQSYQYFPWIDFLNQHQSAKIQDQQQNNQLNQMNNIEELKTNGQVHSNISYDELMKLALANDFPQKIFKITDKKDKRNLPRQWKKLLQWYIVVYCLQQKNGLQKIQKKQILQKFKSIMNSQIGDKQKIIKLVIQFKYLLQKLTITELILYFSKRKSQNIKIRIIKSYPTLKKLITTKYDASELAENSIYGNNHSKKKNNNIASAWLSIIKQIISKQKNNNEETQLIKSIKNPSIENIKKIIKNQRIRELLKENIQQKKIQQTIQNKKFNKVTKQNLKNTFKTFAKFVQNPDNPIRSWQQ